MFTKSFRSSTLFIVLVSAGTSAAFTLVLLLLMPLVRPEISKWVLSSFSPARPSLALQVPRVSPSSTGSMPEEETTIDVVKRTQSSVVAVLIKALPSRFQPRIELFPYDPFQPSTPEDTPDTKRQIGGGSGFFVSSDGIVVTNKHVIAFDSAEYEVLASDGKKYPAKLLATDPVLDIAFLKVEGNGFPYLRFADSDAIAEGQTVIAIGNALDEFRNTVTKGVISGLNRRIIAGDGVESELIEEAIQTDAAINPGNSGGPLIDLEGNVVGLNTAVAQQAQLLGFAMPSNVVRRDLELLKKFGRIVRPFLGVRYQLIDEDLVTRNQLTVDHGALIVRGTTRNELAIAPGSPADKAGLEENDIILEVEGQRVDEDHSLAARIGRFAPGETIELKIFHAGETKTVRVTLDELRTEHP